MHPFLFLPMIHSFIHSSIPHSSFILLFLLLLLCLPLLCLLCLLLVVGMLLIQEHDPESGFIVCDLLHREICILRRHRKDFRLGLDSMPGTEIQHLPRFPVGGEVAAAEADPLCDERHRIELHLRRQTHQTQPTPLPEETQVEIPVRLVGGQGGQDEIQTPRRGSDLCWILCHKNGRRTQFPGLLRLFWGPGDRGDMGSELCSELHCEMPQATDPDDPDPAPLLHSVLPQR